MGVNSHREGYVVGEAYPVDSPGLAPLIFIPSFIFDLGIQPLELNVELQKWPLDLVIDI